LFAESTISYHSSPENPCTHALTSSASEGA